MTCIPCSCKSSTRIQHLGFTYTTEPSFYLFLQFERQKKERENRKKQEALTLEETKEQIAQLEAQLNQHKEEKHQVWKVVSIDFFIQWSILATST